MTDVTILRLPEVLKMMGSKRSTHFQQIATGRFVPAIGLGGRTSGYLKHEVEAIIAAHAIGLGDEKIKELVNKLVAKRKESASKLLQELVA